MLKKRSTRGNIQTMVDGHNFSSKVEARRYLELKSLLNSGTITDLQLQPHFILAPTCIVLGRKRPPMKYIADFVYWRDGKQIIEDVKGSKIVEPVYSLKRHLMKTVLGLDIIEIRYK